MEEGRKLEMTEMEKLEAKTVSGCDVYKCAFAELSDITLISKEGTKIFTLRHHLAEQSKVFAQIFTKDLAARELKLDFAAQGISGALWVLEGESKIRSVEWKLDLLRDVLLFAHAYELKAVVDYCHESKVTKTIAKAPIENLIAFAALAESSNMKDVAVESKHAICLRSQQTVAHLLSWDLPPNLEFVLKTLAAGMEEALRERLTKAWNSGVRYKDRPRAEDLFAALKTD